jgi:hypothetical protein
MWHEVHHEAEYEEICKMSADWLNFRLWSVRLNDF